MGAVDVGVGHDDHPVVAQLGEIEAVADPLDPRSQGDDQRPDVLARHDPVQAGLLDVQDLAAQGQDRLEAPVAALLGRAAGRVALDDEDLAPLGVALLAVGQLARQRQPVEGALPDHEVAGLAGRLAGAGSGQALLDDPPAVARVLLEVLGQAVGERPPGPGP